MLKSHWLGEFKISQKDFWIVFILLFNVLTWYYMILTIMDSAPTNLTNVSTFRTIFYIAIIGSSIAGSLLSEKIERLSLLYSWMILGIVSSFSLIFIYNVTIGHLSLIFLLLGISCGLGIPSCLSYLADYTLIENRGRVAAVIFLLINLSAFPIAILFMTFDLTINSIILTIWRGLGLFLLVLSKPKERILSEKKKTTCFTSIFHDRSLILYFIPWLMFSLVDNVEKVVLGDFFGTEFLRLTLTIEPLIAGFSMLIGGILLDRIGRKRVVMYGFVSLGIAYAMIGMAPTITATWYLYLVIDGIAAGILLLIFILILWGDLSQHGAREKYYAIGNTPFFVRQIVPFLLTSVIASVPANAAFSIASFFLFVAVLPLMYAPETLPEKKIQLRRLRSYLEVAKRIREKHTKDN